MTAHHVNQSSINSWRLTVGGSARIEVESNAPTMTRQVSAGLSGRSSNFATIEATPRSTGVWNIDERGNTSVVELIERVGETVDDLPIAFHLADDRKVCGDDVLG